MEDARVSLVESEHVHQVYDEIAVHFSATRYKAWPIVEEFVRRLPAGSLGVDVGCGNGKNMLIRPACELWMTGVDLSVQLLQLCQQHGFETMQGNAALLPLRARTHDFAICIAVLHHLASRERRVRALQEMARLLVPHGQLLVFVWAFDQGEGSPLRRHDLRPISQDGQDVLVPWKTPSSPTPQMRYYHLFKAGELEELVRETGTLRVTESGYDRDNWYCVAEQRPEE